MKQMLLAALVGGGIVFALSALQNAVFPAAEPRGLPRQDLLLPALKGSVVEAGFYFFPGDALTRGMTSDQRKAAMADHERRFREGPTGVIAYSPGGADFNFGRRLGIVCLAGAFAFGYIEPQYWNWYGFPAAYTAARVAGGIISWAIAGAVMAAIVR